MSTIDLGRWVSEYGALLVFAVTFASCLALPVPASLVMMTAGTFAAAEEISVLSVMLAGIAGAVAGDQVGYHLSRRLLAHPGRLQRSARLQRNLAKAAAFQLKWGNLSVFLSRWLASPLGPWVNFASGMTHFSIVRFTFWGIAGEIIWVTTYVGLGYQFSSQIQQIADLTANTIWIVIAAGLAIFIGRKLFHHRDNA